jgi:flagellar basal-body rod modification protein FlgD
MEAINPASLLSQPRGVDTTSSMGNIGSDDFLKLLITQLRYQDPLEPVDNADLLRQISSIREIELSTTITESLRALTGQQTFASASALIGRYVTGTPDESGIAAAGLVVGVRFAEGGQPILQLANGSEMSVDRIRTIEPPIRAAEALMGLAVVGLDRRDPSDPQIVEGIVTGVRVEPHGEVLLELDTGQDLRFRDFVSVTSVDAI